MTFVLDTNVISELRKSAGKAHPAVVGWARRQPTGSLFLSVVTILEIELGIARLRRRDIAQSDMLQHWLETGVLTAFRGRVLPIDVPVARRAASFHVPDPRPERDALIAATASVQGMSVVTRNVSDFEALGVTVVNPWTA